MAKKPLVEASGSSSLCKLLGSLDVELFYLWLLGLNGEHGLLLLMIAVYCYYTVAVYQYCTGGFYYCCMVAVYCYCTVGVYHY